MLRLKYIPLALAAFLAVHSAPARASSQVPAPPQNKPVALVGGTLHPVSAPKISSGTIVFNGGKIVALGEQVEIPPDAVVVDIRGLHVYPGLIETNSSLGLVEIGNIGATLDYREKGEINPGLRAERAINPDSERLPVTRANGVAVAAILPSGGLISGLGAVVLLDGWTWEQMTLKAPLGLVVDWPDMSGDTGTGPKKELEKRHKEIREAIDRIEEAFSQARAYRTAVEAAGRQGVPFHERDLRWEALLPVLRRELPVWVRANRLQEIEAAVEWADRDSLSLVLVGGADAPRAADLLKAKKIPVVVAPVLELPLRRDSDYDEPFSLAAKLFRAGVTFCIGGEGPFAGNERNLPYNAAMAAAYGLPREEALKAITLYAAGVLGVADRVGSLETGKDATLMVTDGDPLEIVTQVKKLYIQGREADLDNRQKTLYRKYQEKYRQLGEK